MGQSVTNNYSSILFLLIFLWFSLIKARMLADTSEKFIDNVNDGINGNNGKIGNHYFVPAPGEDYVPDLEINHFYRAPKKLIRPRITRFGDHMELFTARGYGKRSNIFNHNNNNNNNCINGICKKEMALFSARRFGKRDPENVDRLIEFLTISRNKAEEEAELDEEKRGVLNIPELLHRRGKPVPGN